MAIEGDVVAIGDLIDIVAHRASWSETYSSITVLIQQINSVNIPDFDLVLEFF